MAKMKSALVKICGITNAEDALWAANLGADYVGLNFFRESPRKIGPDKAREIAEGLPSFVKPVGVFVNPEASEIAKLLKTLKIFILQMHGDESPESLGRLKSEFHIGIWKAVRVEDESSLEKIKPFAGIADAILLDAHKPGVPGGTGETFNWDLAVKAKDMGIPIYLAGGLTPVNVSEAIQKVEPVGVDVASGVEKTGHPRRKDADKMKAFIQKAKGML